MFYCKHPEMSKRWVVFGIENGVYVRRYVVDHCPKNMKRIKWPGDAGFGFLDNIIKVN